MPNQIQSPKEMSKSKTLNQVQDLVRHDKNVILNLGLMKIRLVSESCLHVGIHLAF
jgi:hypothetical protein